MIDRSKVAAPDGRPKDSGFPSANARMKAFDFEASRATATSTELAQYRYLQFATTDFSTALILNYRESCFRWLINRAAAIWIPTNRRSIQSSLASRTSSAERVSDWIGKKI
jgi:hypothetical protein